LTVERKPKILEQIEGFFVNYQKVYGVEVKLMGRGRSAEAREKLEASSKQ